MSLARLSGLDAAYLAAEVPGNHLHLMAVIRLDPSTVAGGYSFEKLREFMLDRLPIVPPLRRRLVEVPLSLDRPRWIEVDEIDIDLHLRRAAVPEPGGPLELASMAAEVSDRALDRSRPLWEIVVVEGLASGEIALLAKLHHSMMDGITGVGYMAALMGAIPSTGARAPLESDSAKPPRPAAPSDLALLVEAVPNALLRPLRLARTTGRTVFSLIRDRLTNEQEPTEETLGTPVPASIFNRRSSPHRSVAFLSLPMQRVKTLGSAFDCTVNDVILALVAGASRRYLARRGNLPAEPLVAAIPASTHGEGDDLANAYTLLFPGLATHLADPAARLRAIRDDSRRRKRARPRGGGGWLSEWVDIPAPWLFHVLARLYVQTHLVERMTPFFNILVSSVPGPPIPLYFAGARITGLHPLGPVYDGMLLNVTAIGREDRLDVGLAACRKGVPALWELADGLEQALDELEASRQT